MIGAAGALKAGKGFMAEMEREKKKKLAFKESLYKKRIPSFLTRSTKSSDDREQLQPTASSDHITYVNLPSFQEISQSHREASQSDSDIRTPSNSGNADPKSPFREACGKFVNSTTIQTLTTICIVANAVILGALTFDYVRDNPATQRGLERADLFILCIFTLEFLLHVVHLGLSTLQNGWLIFDCIVVVLSWVFLDSNVAIFRSFRIFRIFSLVARWESLRILFEAVIYTMPKMGSIWVTLIIFYYIFCVLMTTLYHDLYEEGYLDWDYFGRLDYTFMTLFQMMTLDSWAAIVRQVTVARPGAWIGFFLFVILTSFFIINLFIAVICEALLEVQRRKMARTGTNNHDDVDDLSVISPQQQLSQVIRQQEVIMKIQEDLIRSQVEMRQTLHSLVMRLDQKDGGKEKRISFSLNHNRQRGTSSNDNKNRSFGQISNLSDSFDGVENHQRHRRESGSPSNLYYE